MTRTETSSSCRTDTEHAIVARLAEEFGSSVPPATIVRVVSWSIRDLAGMPAPAIPELAERLARQRLLITVERFTSNNPGHVRPSI